MVGPLQTIPHTMGSALATHQKSTSGLGSDFAERVMTWRPFMTHPESSRRTWDDAIRASSPPAATGQSSMTARRFAQGGSAAKRLTRKIRFQALAPGVWSVVQQ